MIWLIGFIFLFFAGVIIRGAPYVPTHKRSLEALFNELSLKPGSTIIDIGSGDGRLLKMAAQRGYRAIGFEINPILCMVAALRCWAYRDKVTIYWRDFWFAKLPKADLVFVFLAGPFMNRFARKMARADGFVASNGFTIPGWKTQKVVHGIYVYSLPSALQRH